MNGNIANGGLVVKWRGSVLFARPNEWFLNSDDDFIYYSDRSDRNRLYRKQDVRDSGKMLLKRACSGISLFHDGVYFVNEEDRKVYRCSGEGKGLTLCSHTETVEFAILSDGTIYANPDARRICTSGNKVFFADRGNSGSPYALTSYDPESGRTEVFPDIKPSFINTHDGCIYCTDRSRQNKIFRLDSAGGRMTVFGGSAGYLHVIDDWLYFLSERQWKRLSLLNFGEAEDV